MRIVTDDATVEILSENDAKHRGVMIELDKGTQYSFIFYKKLKFSLFKRVYFKK
jgi:hypothetical protein